MRPFIDDPARVEINLDTLMPDNADQPCDMKNPILKVADEGDFFEIQRDISGTIITGFIRTEALALGENSGPDAGGRSGLHAEHVPGTWWRHQA